MPNTAVSGTSFVSLGRSTTSFSVGASMRPGTNTDSVADCGSRERDTSFTSPTGCAA